MLQPSRINVACQQDEKSTPTSISRNQFQRLQSVHKDHTQTKTMASIGIHYIRCCCKRRQEKTPENTHERKPPLTTHLRSQHENQKRLFQRNPSPSERRQAYEKLRQLQSLTRDTENKNMSPHTSMWILTLTSPCDVPASVQGPKEVKTETPINHCPSSQLGALLSLYSPFQTKHPIRSNTVQDVTTIHIMLNTHFIKCLLRGLRFSLFHWVLTEKNPLTLVESSLAQRQP